MSTPTNPLSAPQRVVPPVDVLREVDARPGGASAVEVSAITGQGLASTYGTLLDLTERELLTPVDGDPGAPVHTTRFRLTDDGLALLSAATGPMRVVVVSDRS